MTKTININPEQKNWTEKNNTNREKASTDRSSNVEISYKSTKNMFLEKPRSKSNGNTNCKTIKEAAPSTRPPGIQHYQTRTHNVSEVMSTAPEDGSTIVLIASKFTLGKWVTATSANYTTLAPNAKKQNFTFYNLTSKKKNGNQL